MHKVGNVADSISGADTPNKKQKVKSAPGTPIKPGFTPKKTPMKIEKSPQNSAKKIKKTPNKSPFQYEKALNNKSPNKQEKTPNGKSPKNFVKAPKNFEKTPNNKTPKKFEKTPNNKTPKKFEKTPRSLKQTPNKKETNPTEKQNINNSPNTNENKKTLQKKQKKNIDNSPINAQTNAENGELLLENKAKKAMKRKAESTESPTYAKKGKFDKNAEQRTIFVSKIPKETTKSEIEDLFKPFGTIESIIFRRADKKVPKNFAFQKKQFNYKPSYKISFVVFSTEEEANKALELNGKHFKKINLLVKKSLISKNTNFDNSVFLGNLPFDVEDNEIMKLFLDCGAINSVKVVRDLRTGMGKGYGFINFKNEESVELALQMENVTLRQKELKIDRVIMQGTNIKNTSEWKSIKVQNIPYQSSQKEILNLFNNCGKIVYISLGRDRSLKYAIITYDNADAANKATQLQITFKKNLLRITKDPFTINRKVFLKNIPADTTIYSLKKELEKFGIVKYVKLFKFNSGMVQFLEEKDAEKVINLKTIEINGEKIQTEKFGMSQTANTKVVQNKAAQKSDDNQKESDDDEEMEQDNEDNSDEEMEQDDENQADSDDDAEEEDDDDDDDSENAEADDDSDEDESGNIEEAEDDDDEDEDNEDSDEN